MQSNVDLQLLFAGALVVLGVAWLTHDVWRGIRGIGLFRDDLDRRAGWMALGLILGGGLLLYTARR